MVGRSPRDLWVGTFHAMCVRILRRDGSRIGIGRSFAIIDETDQRQLVKEILDDLDYDERQLAPGACLAEIDKAKNALIWPEQYAQTPDVVRRRAHRQRLHRVSAPAARVELARFRRSDRAHDRPARARRSDAREISAASSSTFWSTSIKTSTPRSTASSRCSRRTTATSPSSATTISRSIRGAAATIA